MTLHLRRLVPWGVILLLVLAGLVWAFRPQPVEVDLVSVAGGRLVATIDGEGEAQVREVYTLSAPIGGRLLRIAAEVGDPVTADLTEIARIEPVSPSLLDVRSESEARAAVEAADAVRDLAAADLERARAELAFAESDLARARQLIVDGTIPQRALDAAERAQRVAAANVATAQATLDVRRHELDQARVQLMSRPMIEAAGDTCTCVTLRAPVDGEILRVIEKSETVVAPGQALVEIGDPADLEIVVDLLSQDAVRIAPGQRAVIDGWGGAPLEASVRRIEPYGFTKVSALGIEEQRVNVRLDILSPPEVWARLGHGYRVDVSVITTDAEVLQVPLGALFRHGAGWAVFVAEDGRARLRAIETGARNTMAAEVLSGLAEGEQVVLYPGDAVSEGTLIAARGD